MIYKLRRYTGTAADPFAEREQDSPTSPPGVLVEVTLWVACISGLIYEHYLRTLFILFNTNYSYADISVFLYISDMTLG